MNYYISDTHFGHANIIRFDDRPFDNVTQMDDGMIRLWNETANNNDTMMESGAANNTSIQVFFIARIKSESWNRF